MPATFNGFDATDIQAAGMAVQSAFPGCTFIVLVGRQDEDEAGTLRTVFVTNSPNGLVCQMMEEFLANYGGHIHPCSPTIQ